MPRQLLSKGVHVSELADNGHISRGWIYLISE